jgi:hypothetical protein
METQRSSERQYKEVILHFMPLIEQTPLLFLLYQPRYERFLERFTSPAWYTIGMKDNGVINDQLK